MSRYADPTKCPDCSAPISLGVTSCANCDLTLTGPTAQLLFRTLTHADQLLAQLRSQLQTQPAMSGQLVPQPVGTPTTAGLPQYPAQPSAPRQRRGLTAASVPQILLGLGATCLLVAALVFLAVAWSVLGVGGRTGVLVALTAAAGGATVWMARKGLRAGAESFVAVALGLLALDLAGAQNAGWFGDLGGSGFVLLVGVVLGVLGAAAAYAALRTQVERLVAAEIVAALGLLLVVVGWIGLDLTGPELTMTFATLASAGVALLARSQRLVVLAISAAALTGIWWMTLAGAGLARAVDSPTVEAHWLHGEIWPLLVAGGLAAAPAFVGRLHYGFRLGGATIAATIAGAVVALPGGGNSTTTNTVIWLTLVLVGAAVTLVVPRRWAWAAVAPLGLAAAGVGVVGLGLMGNAIDRVTGRDPWSADPAVRLTDASGSFASPLLLIPAVLAVALAAWATTRLVVDRMPSMRELALPVAVLVSLAAVATLASYAVPLWLVVAALLAIAVLCVSAARLTQATAGRLWLLAACVVVGAAGLAAAASDWLTAAVLLVATAAAFLFALRPVDRVVAVAAGAAGPALLGGLLWTGAHLANLDLEWRAVLLISVLGLLALARPVVESELTAWAGAALTLGVVGEIPHEATWLAVYLTLAGALVTTSSLVHASRRLLGWPGGLLLAAATWVRLVDTGVTTVEAYTLPSALALLGVGLWHLQKRGASTMTALSPGLVLAVVPSLLVVLVEPVSLRAVLLGAGCLAMIAAGTALKWSAPLVIGASVGLLLVLREAAYADVLPQWVIIGLVGTLLTVVGVTWERRLQEIRLASGYVRSLR